MKYLIILFVSCLFCNSPTKTNLDDDQNTWYIGNVSALYVANNSKTSLTILDSLRTVHEAWIYGHSNFGYSIIARYFNDEDMLNGVLYNDHDSISIPMYRIVLDDRIYYSSLKYGPTRFYSIDSSKTYIQGKPLLLIDKKNGYSVAGSDSIAYIFKVNTNDYIFKINGKFLNWTQSQ